MTFSNCYNDDRLHRRDWLEIANFTPMPSGRRSQGARAQCCVPRKTGNVANCTNTRFARLASLWECNLSHKSTCCEGGSNGPCAVGTTKCARCLTWEHLVTPLDFLHPASSIVNDSVKSTMFKDRFKANPEDFVIV
jgi:hypothetical protein